MQTVYIYKNITVAVVRRKNRRLDPLFGVKCRNARCYVWGSGLRLLEVAGGSGLGRRLAAANGDGCVDRDHLGEDVKDGLGVLALPRH